MLGNIDAFNRVSGGSTPPVGSSTEVLYDLQGATKAIAAYNQYVISGRLILPSSSKLQIQGQVVFI